MWVTRQYVTFRFIMRQRIASEQNNVISNVKDFLVSNKFKIVVIVAVVVLIGNFVARRNNSNADIQQIGSPVSLQYGISIPAQNADGDTVNRDLKIKINDAQRQKRVLVKGNWVRAREGKIFIVVNMDVTNETRAILYGNPVDWARLVEDDVKKVAPSVHQGDLEIRPQSTKVTNIAFIVDENRSSATVELGRIWGLEDTINIEF